MPLDLSGLEETCSLLVPAYGLAQEALAAGAALEASRRIGPYRDDDDVYGMLRRDEWHLQPRGTAQFMFGASALFNEAIGPVGARRTVRLREADEAKPDGTINTCLMVEGLRTCARRHQDRSEYVHGFAAWAPAPPEDAWISALTRAGGDPQVCRTKRVWFGRAGRGALHAPVGDGKERILLLDFHVADRNRASPDLLLVWASCTEVKAGGIPHLDPRGERLDDGWYALIVRAKAGFLMEHGP
jgi:hypothetical protein